MAISSINSQTLLPTQTTFQGNRGTPGSPEDAATVRAAQSVGEGANVSPQEARGSVLGTNAADASRREKNDREPDAKQVKSAVEKLNEFVKATSNSDVQFTVDDESGIRVIKVVDPETKEIIRQMPSKEAVEIAKALGKLQGMLIRQTA